MLCDNVGVCSVLSYCQDEGAILHIGEPVQTFGSLDTLRVEFKNLATNRIDVLEVDADVLELSCVLDGFLPMPGHVYQVTVIGKRYGGGIFAVQIKPYAYGSGDFGVGADTYDKLLVRFVKVQGPTGIQTASEQWLSIPI